MSLCCHHQSGNSSEASQWTKTSTVGCLLEALSGEPASNPTPGAGPCLTGGRILWRALATPTSSAIPA